MTQAFGGTTDVALALTDATKLLELRPRKDAETIVIVITDGRSQVCPEGSVFLRHLRRRCPTMPPKHCAKCPASVCTPYPCCRMKRISHGMNSIIATNSIFHQPVNPYFSEELNDIAGDTANVFVGPSALDAMIAEIGQHAKCNKPAPTTTTSAPTSAQTTTAGKVNAVD